MSGAVLSLTCFRAVKSSPHDGRGRRVQEGSKVGVSLQGVDIIDPLGSPELLDKYADALVEARKHKGLSREAAEDALRDGNYFATMMVCRLPP